MFISTPVYAAIPTSTDSALSDISLNKVGCSTKDIPLPYMEGTIQAGQILHIPAIPTHHILCLVDDGASHKIPYNTIQETSHAIPVRPTAHNITSVAPPDIIPCISCAHNTIQTKMGGTAISSAVTISSQDGIMDTSVSGYGTYDSTLTRTWTTTKASGSVSFWNPEVVVRDGGSAHVSWYRNGMLVHSDKIHCERASYSDDTRRTIQQGMHVIHQWSYKYIHKCNSDIDAYHSIHVKQGDIIQVTLEISPDIAMRMDDHNNTGTSDTTMQACRNRRHCRKVIQVMAAPPHHIMCSTCPKRRIYHRAFVCCFLYTHPAVTCAFLDRLCSRQCRISLMPLCTCTTLPCQTR